MKLPFGFNAELEIQVYSGFCLGLVCCGGVGGGAGGFDFEYFD